MTTIRRDRRRRLHAARLLLVIGAERGPAGAPDEIAAAAVRGGADAVQVRWKGARGKEAAALATSVRGSIGGALLFMNDDVEAAAAADADGVHLGPHDMTPAAARARLGDAFLIGVSTRSASAVVAAAEAGIADYAGLGAMFATRTKADPVVIGPAALEALPAGLAFPVFPIGGITAANADELVRRGCGRAAVSSAISRAADPERAARAIREVLERAPLPAQVQIGARSFTIGTLDDDRALEMSERAGCDPYFAVSWPAATALALELDARGPLANTRVLDLGCGPGLPGIVAAALGAEVTFADVVPDALALARRNATANGVRGSFVAIDFRELAARETFDLVLASDLLYEPGTGDALAAALQRLVAPDGLALVADPMRPSARRFADAARARGFTVSESVRDGVRIFALRRGRPS